MFNLKKNMKRLGAGIMASLCAVSLFSTSIGGTLSAGAAMTTENTAFPTADEVIAEAATLLGSPYGWGCKGYSGIYYQDSYSPLDLDYVRNQGVDCSGLLYYTLTHLGYSTSGFSWNNPVPVDTPHWLSVNDNCTITYNGITSKIDVEKSNIPYTERPYWECADGSTISAGSMVIAQNPYGEDHSWIYMGEFDSRNDVIAYLKSIGVNESYISSRTVGDGNGDGGTHWRIESNGSEGCVINNRTDGKSSTALNMSAFRVTLNDVKFTITKVLSTDNSVKINGISSIDGSKAVYGVYTDKNCTHKVGEITIGTDGTGSIKLPNKQYYVKEISAPKGYDLSSDVVALKANGSVNVEEDVTSGKITINKTAEDGVVADREFRISWTDNGKKHSKTAVTDENGIAEFDGLHVYDFSTKGAISYTVSEVNTDSKYVTTKSQDITLTSGNADLTVGVKFENRLKKFKAEVKKTDSENVSAQGDATLSGATYGLYRDGERIATYTTDENGHFITDEFICGSYTLQELTPSKGYQLNDTIYKVGAEPQNYTVEVNPVALTVNEDVIKGKVALIKHSDDGTTGIETPESGSEFEIFLKSAGSFNNAKETERDYLTTDENGFAQTKELPYGTYTVHQVTGWKNTEFVEDFDVIIDENGKTYQYILNDAVISANIQIVKKDAETGKVIPVSGVGFKIWSVDRSEYISQNINYPEETTLDTFYTNNSGTLMLPKELTYGDYKLHEVKAPTGYFLNNEPVPFTVDGSEKVITVEKYDTPQKGRISVSKRGDIFKSVTAVSSAYENKDGEYNDTFTTYTPVFAESGLFGAEFEVRAAEDIYTADGTLRASYGEVVADLITDTNGYAVTGELYLGKYTVSEKKAPVGFVLNSEEKLIELTYAGQEVAVSDAVNSSFINDHQGVDIHLEKFMEHDEKFDIGDKDEYKNVTFGLFAAEDITAADGTVIPENGLVSTVTLSEDMTAHFKEKLPFARYYVQEIATDESYMLNGEKYLVNFKYMGQEHTTVDIDCGTFVNNLKRGSVSGKKVNEKDEPLEKALFGLFSADTTEFNAENALLTTESDKDGKFGFTDIPYGEYIVKEIAAPTGYILSEKQYKVNISEDGDVVEIIAVNRPISVSISKTDIYGKELTDAKMQLIDVNGKVVDEWTSSDEAHIISNIPYGGYMLKEIAAPAGYVIATDIQFTIDENGNVTVDGVKANAYNSDGVPCITMVDKAVDKPTTPPPTGDAGRGPLGLAMIIVGLCGVFHVSYKYRKMTKGKDTFDNGYSDLCPDFVEGAENE
ncbi:SpaA isopeptide-forming pilin-related protein [uncultured Ruminococcus sp.]|uniref:SpaA isopeptide-forming pilin-related protein n=1 Tax=uncultured Ruminococcus sp. TaxID=165186 RepID=UPI00262BEB9E|nr:SpaA isopeptide-forming pilin-related protein [uncultured Ruminococcus sp.]